MKNKFFYCNLLFVTICILLASCSSKNDINTNSLKAFLMDGLGLKGGVQKFTVEDIPACIHFQEVSYAELAMPEGAK